MRFLYVTLRNFLEHNGYSFHSYEVFSHPSDRLNKANIDQLSEEFKILFNENDIKEVESFNRENTHYVKLIGNIKITTLLSRNKNYLNELLSTYELIENALPLYSTSHLTNKVNMEDFYLVENSIKRSLYPVTLIPEIYFANNFNQFHYAKVENPVEPKQLEYPKEPSNILYFIFAFLALAVGSVQIGENNWIIGLLCFGFLIFMVVLSISASGSHQEAIKSVSERNNQNWKDYRDKLSAYEYYIAKEKELESLKNNPNNTVLEKRKMILSLQKIGDLIVESVQETKAGFLESYFYKILSAKYSDRIHRNKRVGSYYPDFIYVDNEKNVYINIEIDEPYVLDTNEPIHYEGIDESRNSFFMNMGFSIIRFSERQIYFYAEICVEHIDNIIRCMETGENYIQAALPFDIRWNKEEAKLMASQRLREKYLNIPYSEDPFINKDGFFIPKDIEYDDLPF